MKKARLFAVAAAMGMFASTVTAGEVSKKPTKEVKKETTVVEISANESIVRAEFGGNIVLPEVNTSAYTTTRTTKIPSNYSYANQLTGKQICYNGFTGEAGMDSNIDGIVDVPFYTWDSNGKADDNWFYDDGKTWSTDGETSGLYTWQYYTGLYSEAGMSGRVLVPGASKVEGWHLVTGHKNFTKAEDVLATLLENGKIEEVYDGEDLVGYRTAPKFTYDGDTDIIKEAEYIQLTTGDIVNTSRTKLVDVQEQFVNLLAGIQLDNKVVANNQVKTIASYNIATDANGEPVATAAKYTVNTTATAAGAIIATTAATNSLAVDYEFELPTVASYGAVVVIDGNDKVTAVISGDPKELEKNVDVKDYVDYMTRRYITVVRHTTRYGIEEVDSFRPETYKNDVLHNYYFSNGSFVAKNTIAAPTNVSGMSVKALQKLAGGLYAVNTPANPTEKYLFDYNLGTYDYDTTDILDVNRTKLQFYFGDTTYNAVKLSNGKYYPAFDTEQEVIEFMQTVAAIGQPSADNSTFTAQVGSRKFEFGTSTRTWANGDYTEKYAPANGLDAPVAQQCTYGTDKEAVSGADINVTSNASSIDTNTYGVKTLTITASYGDAKASTEVSVVIAPKYEREWQNGKVTKLTARHLNGNVYAVYTYNYTTMTGTATFYKADGETVDSVAPFEIK